jgi:hypothetical protein
MIQEFEWTNHATYRRRKRRVSQAGIEAAINSEHPYRVTNAGEGDWMVSWVAGDGRPCEVVYDHPVYGDASVVRVVTVFPVRTSGQRQVM